MEDQSDRLLYPTISILLNTVIIALQVPDRYGSEEFSAPSLLLPGLGRTLSEDRQLHLADSCLHAEQQPIVRVTRFVDTILIDDQSANQPAELKQRVAFAPVAREP